MDKSKKRHIEWSKRQEKKPSMKRRCDEHDYTQRGIYMITIAAAILEAQLPLIVLLLKGFPPFFKPQPRYLIACAEGRLLMLSPYPWQNEKITNMHQRCLQLNDMTAEICKYQF